jgi:hypothetical protein
MDKDAVVLLRLLFHALQQSEFVFHHLEVRQLLPEIQIVQLFQRE